MLRLLSRFSGLAAVITFVLAVWAVAQASLAGGKARGLASLYVLMVPATAILFILLAGAHAMYRMNRGHARWRRVEQVAAGSAIAIVLLILSQDLAGLSAWWMAVARIFDLAGPRPIGRMAPSSGLAFILTAVSMLAGTFKGARARRVGAAAAALGVALACFGLTRVVVAFPAQGTRPMAVMAAAGFILLNLALLLDRWGSDSTGTTQAPGASLPMPLVASTLLIILVAASAGSMYMHQRVDQARVATARELDSIADLKLAQIVAWRNARLSEGRFVMRTLHVAKDVARLAEAPNDTERQAHLADWLTPLLAEGRSRRLTVVTADGRRLFSIPEGSSTMPPRLERRETWTDVELGDIRRADDGSLSLDLVVPIGEGSPAAFVAFEIDPATSLFPILHRAPLPVKSLESTLSRREGSDVVLLSRPSAVRFPISEEALPEAAAARGEHGAREGVDYRGVPVLATSRLVPGSTWTMTTKIDQEELYAPVQEDASRTAMFVIIFLFGLIGFAAYVAREESALALEKALRAEVERAATADRLATLMKSANDMILLFDEQDRIVEVNDRVSETYGYTRAELIGMPVARLRADGDVDAIAAGRVAMSVPGGGHIESVHRRKDGSTFPIDVSGRAVEIDGRTVVMAIYRDVTERRMHDEALRQSEERLRLLGDNLPDSYLYQCVYDGAGGRRFVYVSSGVRKLHGLSAEDVLRDASLLNRQTLAEDLEHVLSEEKRSLEQMTDFSVEIRIRRADGEERWLQIRSRPRRDGSGSIIWDGVATDITERKQSDAVLRQVRSAVEQSPISILMADPDWTIRYVNPAFTEITGYTAAEAIGRKPRELLGDHNPQELHDDAEASIAAGRVWEGVFRNRRKNGEPFWEKTRLAPVRDERGVISSFIAVKEDITAHLEHERALRDSESKLAEAIDVADLGCYETWEEEARVLCDARAIQMLGLEASSTTELRDHWIAHMHPEDALRVVPQARAVWTGATERFEVQYRYLQPGHGEIWVSHVSRAVEVGPDGKVRRTIGVVKDITAEKSASEVIRKSEERHRLLADNASDVIWTTDTEGRMTYVSPSVERLRGYAPSELLGRSFAVSVTPEHHASLWKMFTEAVALFQSGGGTAPHPSQRFEIDQPCKNGTVVHTEVTASPMFDAEHRFVGVLGVTRDMTARHATDLALKASEFRLQMAMETAQLGIIELRDGGHSPDAIACDVLGLEPGFSTRHAPSWFSRIHPGDLERVKQVRESFLSGKERALSSEYRYLHPVKGQVWISHASRALAVDEQGRTIRAVVVVKDITDIRRAEQELRSSEGRLSMALEAAELGLYWSDNVLFGSDPRARAILGVSGTDWKTALAFWTAHIHPDDHEETIAAVTRVREGAATQAHLEYRYLHPEGNTAWISHSLRVVQQSESGEPERVIGVVKDVTAERQAEADLQFAEERWKFAIEGAGDGVWDWDVQEGTCVFSPRWKEMLGYAEGEIGTDLREWTERVHPDDLAGVLATLQPHLDGLQSSYAAEHRLRCKDGSYKWVLDRGLVVSRDAKGRPLRVVGTHSDITGRRQAEEDLRNLAATRAAQLDELRRWQQAMLGREDRIQELKREVNGLARSAGKEPPYPSQEPVA